MHTGLVGTQHLTCAYGHLRERRGREQGRKEEPSPSEEAVDRRLQGSGAGAVCAAAGRGGAAPRWGGAQMNGWSPKWLEHHSRLRAPARQLGCRRDQRLLPWRVVSPIAPASHRSGYASGHSSIPEECCKPGVSSDSAWHTAPTDISLRAVTTRAIRMAYGTALSKVCVILIFANIRAGWVRSTGSPIFASIRAGWVRSTGLLRLPPQSCQVVWMCFSALVEIFLPHCFARRAGWGGGQGH